MPIKIIFAYNNNNITFYRASLNLICFLLFIVWVISCDARLSSKVPTTHRDSNLFKSCAKGEIKKIQDLINAGANVNATEAEGETPLMYASAEGQIQVIDILIDRGANIHAKSIHGQTALGRAALYGHSDVVEKLLIRGAKPDEQMDDGGTPLMYSANVATTTILLKYRADINGKDRNGITPLMGAASNGKMDIVKVLIEAGAQVDIKDNSGRTALQWAKDRNQKDVIKFFENKS